jgi:peptide/nickel transport system permease protein
MVPVVILVTMLTFILLLLTGDPAQALLGDDEVANNPAEVERIRKDLGLDKPIPVQYALWLGNILSGDLGTSIRTSEPVIDRVLVAAPRTIELSLIAFTISILIAIPAGVIAAIKRNTIYDYAATILAVLGVAVPGFWLGIMMILAFSVYWQILPPGGYVPLYEGVWDNVSRFLMPAFALGISLAAVGTRQMRSSLIEVMEQDYIRTARAKGLIESRVVMTHALKNALLPVVTVIGLQVGRLVGGSIIIEQIFFIPGLGRLAVEALSIRDFPVVQAIVLLVAFSVMFGNLLVDVLYAYLDPRIRYS